MTRTNPKCINTKSLTITVLNNDAVVVVLFLSFYFFFRVLSVVVIWFVFVCEFVYFAFVINTKLRVCVVVALVFPILLCRNNVKERERGVVDVDLKTQ